MAVVPTPHQFAVGEDVTAANINTLFSASAFLLGRPVAMLRRTNTAQNIAGDGAYHDISWDQADFDTDAGWSLQTNPTRYTVQTTGKYLAVGAPAFAVPSSGTQSGKIITTVAVTGAHTNLVGTMGNTTISGAFAGASSLTVAQMTAGTDWFGIGVIQTIMATNLPTYTTNGGCWMAVFWLGT